MASARQNGSHGPTIHPGAHEGTPPDPKGECMNRLFRTTLFAGVVAFGVTACGDDVSVVDPGEVIPPLSATLTPANQQINVGETADFAVGVSGGDPAQSASWTCSSSNTGVASVAVTASGCTATGVAAGNASITATVTRGTQTTNAGAQVVVGAVAPASVTISAINQGGVPAPINNIMGQIDVVLNINPGDEALQRVDLLVDGEVVASQTFTAAMLAAMLAEAEDGPEGAQVQQVTLSFNTAAYELVPGEEGEPPTAVVDHLNGPKTISADLFVVGRDVPRASNTIQVTFNNQDIVDILLESGTQGMDAGGLLWRGQGVTATFVHVSFSGDVATSFASTFGGLSRSTNPAVFPQTGAGGSNLTDFNSQSGGVCPSDPALAPAPCLLTVAAIIGGDPGATSSRVVRYDGVAPNVGIADGLTNDFRLVDQLLNTTRRCCSNNWTNPDYSFSTGAPSTSDEVGGVMGVGNITITYHSSDDPSMTNAQIAALGEGEGQGGTPAEAGLDASNVNTAYTVVARVADAVDNVTLQRLQAFSINPAQTFGVDENAPFDQMYVGTVAHQTIYNTNAPISNAFAVGTLALSAVDDVAGFGATPVAVRFQFRNATQNPVGALGCLIGSTTANCNTPTQQALSIASTNASGEGYYRYQGQVYDQGGLGTGEVTEVMYLFDETPPNVDNISGTAGTFTAAQQATFSANASDNVDLWQAQFSFVYAGAAFPFGPPSELGPGWNFDAPTTEATAQATVPFVVGMQQTDAGGAPTGAPASVEWARFVVRDIAQNSSTQQNNFVIGSFPAPVDFAPAFPGGASFQNVTAAVNLCANDDEDCTAPDVRTVTLTATATGPSGTFQNPFAFVVFAYMDGAGELRYIDTDATATVTDDGALRTWTWSVTLNGSDVVAPAALPTAIDIVTYGVNGTNGTGLVAQVNSNVTLIDN